MTILYVAGPMTGYPEKNYPAFHSESARLRALGYTVFSPAEAAASSVGWTAAMRIDIVVLMGCDAIVTLDGWEKSRGAKIEVGLFRDLELPVYHYSDVVDGEIQPVVIED